MTLHDHYSRRAHARVKYYPNHLHGSQSCNAPQPFFFSDLLYYNHLSLKSVQSVGLFSSSLVRYIANHFQTERHEARELLFRTTNSSRTSIERCLELSHLCLNHNQLPAYSHQLMNVSRNNQYLPEVLYATPSDAPSLE